MLVTACIVTHTYSNLIASLMSLINQTQPIYQIIIGLHQEQSILNKSQDRETVERLMNYFPNVFSFNLSDMSFVQAREFVAKQADTEYILTFDGDQSAAPNFLKTLVKTVSDNTGIVAVSGKLINIDPNVDIQYNEIYQMPAIKTVVGTIYAPYITSCIQLVKRDVYLECIKSLPDVFWTKSEFVIGGEDVFMSSLYSRFGKVSINYNAYCYHLRLAPNRVFDGGHHKLEIKDDWIPEALYNTMEESDFYRWAKEVKICYNGQYTTIYDILDKYSWHKGAENQKYNNEE